MAQRNVVVSTLDVGRGNTFTSFIDERLDKLKEDLLRECDRIAAARELKLKNELDKTKQEKQELQSKLRKAEALSTSKDAADQQDSAGQGCESVNKDASNQDATSMVLSDSELNAIHLDASPEPQRKANGSGSSVFALWGEWSEPLPPKGNSSLHSSESNLWVDEDEDFEDLDQEKEWAWNIVQRGHERIIISRGTINPNHTPAVVWEVIGIPILFYDLVTIPMQTFTKPEGIVFDIISWILLLYWTSDLLLRLLVFGTSNKDGEVSLDRKKIMKHYLLRSFLFDFFMVAPDWFSKFLGSDGMRNVAILRLFRILRLMRLMRMSKIKKIVRNIEDVIDSEFFTVCTSILVNLFAIIGTCHYMACFWFWLGTIKIKGHESWVERYLEDAAWEYQYVMSMHWAIAQFTPGSSRIQPCNILEAAASICVLIFGLIFLSLFISALSQARAKLQALTSKADRDNWMLRRYLKQQGVSADLVIRAMHYVEKCVEPMMVRVQRKDVHLLPLLSRPLQLEVQEQQFFHTLIRHPFLKSLRARSLSLTLHLFVSVIIEIMLADSDLLFEAGSVAHEMYFVSRGALAYLPHGSNKPAPLHVGDWCSELVIFVPWVHNGTTKSAVDSHVLSIDSAKMRAAVLEHKERIYVTKCALGYLKDLNRLLENGETINDVTRFLDEASSEYLHAVAGKSASGSLHEIASKPTTELEI